MGSVWLDAFAGTGAVGLEALSRGADLVIWNDQSRDAHRVLEANLKRCGVESGFRLYHKNVFALLEDLEQEVSFVFLDPPYRFSRHQKLLERLKHSRVFSSQTIILLEISKRTGLDILPPGLEVFHILRAGDSHLLWIRTDSRGAASEG